MLLPIANICMDDRMPIQGLKRPDEGFWGPPGTGGKSIEPQVTHFQLHLHMQARALCKDRLARPPSSPLCTPSGRPLPPGTRHHRC